MGKEGLPRQHHGNRNAKRRVQPVGLLGHVELGKRKWLGVRFLLVGIGGHDQNHMLDDDEDVNHARVLLNALSSILATVPLHERLTSLHDCVAGASRLSIFVWDDENRAHIVVFLEEVAVLFCPLDEIVDLLCDQRSDLVLDTTLTVATDANVKLEKSSECLLSCCPLVIGTLW